MCLMNIAVVVTVTTPSNQIPTPMLHNSPHRRRSRCSMEIGCWWLDVVTARRPRPSSPRGARAPAWASGD
jgi:hypothetical protein